MEEYKNIPTFFGSCQIFMPKFHRIYAKFLRGNFKFSNPFWNYICIITGNHKSTVFEKRLGYIINFRLLL